ncbi:MAG: class I SAM-dependent RNA methyltransferase [Alphaproteobacteria bacterium]|nr:MAG: class I SAM-dependent RNA methyltransferase [Alphaproteobacteria bacterium]
MRAEAARRVLADAEQLSDAPERRAPPCPHFGRCGGCVLQHASAELEGAWKCDLVRAALGRHGLEAELVLAGTAPPGARRRARLVGRRRGQGAEIGFRARRSREIVPIRACPVLRPEIVAALPHLRALVAEAAGRRPVELAVTATDAGLDVDLTGAPEPGPGRAGRLAAIARAADLARLTLDGAPLAVARTPRLRLGPAEVALPPGGFVQAAAESEALLQREVLARVGAAERVADLFAGIGTFSLPLAAAPGRRRVHAVEGAAAAIEALAQAARAAAGLCPLSTELRDLARRPLLAEELAAFDAVVLDPPRAGAAEQVAALAPLAGRGWRGRVVMVSCNPASFARDAARLHAAGWRITGPVAVVNQFRWSAHVELVATLEPRG